MEHLYPTLAVLFLSFVTLCLFFLFHRHWSNYSAPNLPPGRPGFPLIGETLDFLSTGWRGHPERFIFDRVSRYASHVFKSNLFCQPMAVFCGPTANKFLFSNENKLVVAWWPESVNKVFPSSLQTSANEEAIKVRKLLPQFLKPEALKGYIAVMDEVAHRHFVSDWETETEVQVFPLAKKYTFQVACRLFLSIDDPAEVARFFDPFAFIASGIISLPVDFPGTPFNKGIKASKVIRKELLKVIEQRRKDLVAGKATATQDILSHMATCGEEMKDLDIADKILGLLIGGHDTASAACTFIVKFLAEFPDIYHGVFTEQMEIVKSKAEGEALNWEDIQKMKYSWNVACEVMRIAPPLQGAFREALSDFIFEGFFIPKGWKLYWSTHSTHKDPKWFPEPEKFDPSRFEGDGPAPYTFVPFGGGPRMCPGKEYARLEILVFMHNLVKRFKWEKLVPQEGIIVDPLPMPAKGLPVRLYHHT